MDPLRPSHAFPSDAPDLLRQPSAEDLDAAHQLVSSARGRNSEYGAHEKRTSFSDDQPLRTNAEAEEESVRQQDQARNAPANGDSINLGQICRYE
jgi:GATA-binding protein, other eukaryote